MLTTPPRKQRLTFRSISLPSIFKLHHTTLLQLMLRPNPLDNITTKSLRHCGVASRYNTRNKKHTLASVPLFGSSSTRSRTVLGRGLSSTGFHALCRAISFEKYFNPNPYPIYSWSSTVHTDPIPCTHGRWVADTLTRFLMFPALASPAARTIASAFQPALEEYLSIFSSSTRGRLAIAPAPRSVVNSSIRPQGISLSNDVVTLLYQLRDRKMFDN